ncbi:hypothetical protein [Acinetobacter gerneri]|uniref:hypothetical protein n=1 Tax=Acinetobacter gerneri TaxID=202952 RepID=UPI003A838A5E
MNSRIPPLASITPNEIIQHAQKLTPENEAYLHHPIVERFGSPLQPIHIDQCNVDINGVQYESPIILPIYDGRLRHLTHV